MDLVLLGILILVLLFYMFLMIDTIILIKKSGRAKRADLREVLIKRVNLAMVLTVVIAAIIIVRILLKE